MAAVFTLTTVMIARHTEIVSRWLTVAGLACAVVLLAGIGISPWAELVFPAWILALSLDVLAAGLRAASAERLAGPSAPVRLPPQVPEAVPWHRARPAWCDRAASAAVGDAVAGPRAGLL